MSGIWSELSTRFQVSNSLDCLIYPIEDQTALSVIGPDSQKFMQGQFTCNLSDITPESFRPGACCNAKGRMVSSFNLMQLEEGQYLLGLHQSLAESTLQHLKKYMVFFKAQMQPANFICAGITGQDAEATLSPLFTHIPQSPMGQVIQDGHILIKLPHDAGYQLWLDAKNAEVALEAIANKCLLSTNSLWNKNLIEHGLGYVTQETAEAFIPQMMNLTQAGGVSFSKGCYTGQEIVARMQYLGKLKRHMYHIAIEPEYPITANDEVFAQGKASSIGHVVNAVNLEGFQQALVVMEDKHLPLINEGQVIIGPKQAIATKLLSLPYDVIDEQSE